MNRLRLSIARLATLRNRRVKTSIVFAFLALVVSVCTAVSMFLAAFAQNKQTYCGLDHTHTTQCYSNPQADVETERDWKEALPEFDEEVPLLTRLVDIAKSQLGYTQSANNYLVQDNGELAGYTRYGAWAGDPYANWNVPFVNFCLENAGIDKDAFAKKVSSSGDDALADEDKGAEPEDEAYEDVEEYTYYETEDGNVFATREEAEAAGYEIVDEEEEPSIAAEQDAVKELGQPSEDEPEGEPEDASRQDEELAYPPADASAWENLLRGAGLYASVSDASDPTYASGFEPAAGDLVFVRARKAKDGEERKVRMGIVLSVNANKGKMRVVEGDSGGRVERKTYQLSNSRLVGYGQMPAELREEQDAYDAAVAEQKAAEEAQKAADLLLEQAEEVPLTLQDPSTPPGEEAPQSAEAAAAQEEAEEASQIGESREEETKDTPQAERPKGVTREETPADAVTQVVDKPKESAMQAKQRDEQEAELSTQEAEPVVEPEPESDSKPEPVPEPDSEPEPDPEPVPQVLTAQADGYLITADLAGQARKGYTLRVKPLKATSARLAAVEAALSEELPNGAVKQAHVNTDDVVLFDISIRNKDGKEVEPGDQVRITVSPADSFATPVATDPEPAIDASSAASPDNDAPDLAIASGEARPAVTEVMHLAKDGASLTAESLDANPTAEGFEFTATSFSPFAFVYTVDFEYAGYTYNLEGGSHIMLSELIRALGLEFGVSNVMRATFSDPSLLAVQKVAGEHEGATDWELKSLKPFTTAEVLSLTLTTGELVTITVTDAQHITELSNVITNASLSVDGVDIPWPALVRQGAYYDLRLEFKENDIYQFMDDNTAMTYTLPRGISIGDTDFERTFTMDVSDGVQLRDNIVQYNADLRTFFIIWNTNDTVGFNKLIASAVAQFRLDLQVQFDFNPDKLDFGNDVFGEVIRDTRTDVDIQKTGVYNRDADTVDYDVTVTAHGLAENVAVEDVLFGTALTYDISGGTNGITWESTNDAQNSVGTPTVQRITDADLETNEYQGRAEGDPKGFSLVVGQMQDGETITFHYSAKVDYNKLTSGSGNWDETYNKVTATINGTTKEASHAFEGEMRYVELQKFRDQVNWGDADTTNVNWTVRVNRDPKVGLAGTTITDTIYAGDVEAMHYAGAGIHVRVYDKSGVFVGEYDAPWGGSSDENANPKLSPRQYRLDGMTDAEIAEALARARKAKRDAEEELELAYDEENEEAALAAAAIIREAEREIALYEGTGDPYDHESWSYTIPETVEAVNGSQTVTINNTNKYYYDITYTTEADKTLMTFDGYVGNEVEEDRTNNLMQGGLYPPGVGTVPEVKKEVDTQHSWAPKGSNEDYIYWKISFQRQPYTLTRCVIEDNNPLLYGCREEVDVGDKTAADFGDIRGYIETIVGTDPFDGSHSTFDILKVEGLRPEEGWQIAGATNTRTTFRFYQNKAQVKPGLLARTARPDLTQYATEEQQQAALAAWEAANTVTIYLRTKNSEDWINGTLTRYWSRDHTNAVTWIPNAHQVDSQATATPDIRKIEKTGVQVGSIKDETTGVMLPIFRFELYLTGVSRDDFVNGTFQIHDQFNTNFLQFAEVSNYNTPFPNMADAVSHKVTVSSTDQQELNVGWWDQFLKGYSKANKWVGPVRTTVRDKGSGGADGVTFVVAQSDFENPNTRNGLEPGTTDEYCMRYSLPYYLAVKDADAAQKLAQLPAGEYTEGEFAGITKTEDGKVQFSNTATWGESSLTSQINADADFNPMSKTLVYDSNTDTCTYTIVINPQQLKLNNGEMVCVRDSYTNLAVDFVTVADGITTVPPDRKDQVEWSYHNNVGTFWIPDETMVTITYKAQPIGEPGKSVTFNNTVSMLNFAPKSVPKTVKLSSESEGTAGDYNIRLFKYADNSMNHPLEGAVFQLYEEDASGKVPVTFKKDCSDTTSRYQGDDAIYADYGLLSREQRLKVGDLLTPPAEETNADHSTGVVFPTRENHRVGDYVYFCTTEHGYADVHLNQSLDGVALARGKQYYLKEIVTPDGYTKEDIYWSFVVDDMDYFDAANEIFVYRDGGVLTVANSSGDSGIVLRKSFTGNVPSWDVQKGATFQIEVKEQDTGNVVYKRTTTYEDFAKDNSYSAENPVADSTPYRFKVPKEALSGLLDKEKIYVFTVTESNADVETHTRTTASKTQVGEGTQTSGTGLVATATATGHQLLDDGLPVRFWFTNTYTAKPVNITVSKTWGTKASAKVDKSVEFELYRNDEAMPLQSFSLSDANGWSKAIAGLSRYDASGNAYVYSVKEKTVRYKDQAGGTEHVVEGDDLDVQFTITATEGDEVLPMVGTSAQADTYGRLTAEVNFNNEIATLVPISVQKTWSDRAAAHPDEDVYFDLYRTTNKLPTGGSNRETYTLMAYQDSSALMFTSYPETIDVKNGDLLEITLRPDYNYNYTGTYAPNGDSLNWKQHAIGFSGISGFRNDTTIKNQWREEFLEDHGQPKNTAFESYYAFEPITLFDQNNRDRSSEFNFSNHAQKGVSGNAFGANPVLKITVRADHLEQFGGSYTATNQYTGITTTLEDASHYLFLRGYSREIIVDEIRNITAEEENLTRSTLEHVASHSTTQLVRSNITLDDSQNWQWSSSFPRDDGNGNEYTYFVIEHDVAGYTDGYKVNVATTKDENDVDPRDHTILIANTKDVVDELHTSLTIRKNIAFEPAVSGNPANYENMEFHVTVKNGNKYVVNSGTPAEPVWELMTPTAYNAKDLSPYLVVTTNQDLVITGIPEGTYTIEETDANHHNIPGYTLTATYDNQVAKLTNDETRPVTRTITNTYKPIPPEGSFTFSKVWSAASELMPVEWPSDETIRVQLHRRLLNQDEQTVAQPNDDENFLLTYDIKRYYDAVSNEYKWSIEPVKEEAANWKLDTDVKIDPVVEPTADPGRFFNYAFTVTGVKEQVTCDVAGTSKTYDCAYYVTEVTNAHYETHYGTMRGSSLMIDDAVKYADAGKALINQLPEEQITFTKEWFGQNRDEKLTEWPTRVIEKDPESDEGANPDAEVQTEPVPITIRLGRKLRYQDGLVEVESADFDPTYNVTFPNLTDAKTAISIHPDEGKVSLSMTNNNGAFVYTIDHLQKFGSMEIGGEDKHGEWVYYVFENNVDGYAANYYEYSASYKLFPREDPSVPSGGLITNTQLLGTMALQKKIVGVELAESKTFNFAVRRKGTPGTSLYLLEDGSLVGQNTPHVLSLTIEAGKTSGGLNFQDVVPGEYEVVELGTINADGSAVEGGVAQIAGYDLTVTPTNVTVEPGSDGNPDVTTYATAGDATLQANSTALVTFTNTYALKKTNMQFQKVWLPRADAQNPTTPIAWPAGESITIELHRKVEVLGGEDFVDEDFVLVYEGKESNGSVVWTATQGESSSLETDADQVLVSKVEDNHIQTIQFKNLTECVLDGEHEGKEWTYYLVERQNPRSNYARHYGKVEGGQAVVSTDTDAMGTEFREQGGQTTVVGPAHDSAIINREDFSTAQLTKVWQNSDGVAIDWPKDAGGTDIPIVITATGTKTGAENDVRTYTLTTAALKPTDTYTFAKNDTTKAYTFTFYGLKPDYTYAFTEATLAGYTQSPTEAVASDGVITNTVSPTAKTTVTVTKRWSEEGHGNDQITFRLYKAITVTDPNKFAVSVRPEFYDARGHEVVPSYGTNTWRICSGNLTRYTLSGTSQYYQWLGVTYHDGSNLKIGEVDPNYPLLKYRPSIEDANTVFLDNNPKDYVLPSESEYYDATKDIAIVMKFILPPDEAAEGSSSITVAPRGVYNGLPVNAVPAGISKSVKTKSSSSDLNPNTETFSFDDLDTYDSNGFPITYYVLEERITTGVSSKDIAVFYEHVGNNWTITNMQEHKNASITKKWFNAEGAQATWPKGSGDADLPITVQVTRRLAYDENGTTKYTADQTAASFSLTYKVTAAGGELTHVNGRAATTDEKALYTMTVDSNDNDYTYTIANLDNVGTLAVGGVNKSGKWDYRFAETSVPEGYAANTAAKVNDGGTISNTQKPVKAQFAVTKRLQYGDAHWPAEGFEFTLESAGTNNPQPTMAKTPNTVTITSQTPSSRASFADVSFAKEGTYTFSITETVPDNAKNKENVAWSAATQEQKDASDWFMLNNIRYNHKPTTVTAVVTNTNGVLQVQSITYETNDKSLTVSNTYAGKVGFSFSKAWLKMDATLPATEFVAWPADRTIDLSLKRYTLNESTGAYVEDVGFEVKYTGVGANDASVEPASVKAGGDETANVSLAAETKTAYTFTRTATSANRYDFVLPEGSLDGLDDDGKQYAYHITETGPADTTPEYALKNVAGQVYKTTRDYAADDGVIVNRDMTTNMSISKIWQDVQGTDVTGWPSDASINLELGWSTDGSEPEVGNTQTLSDLGPNSPPQSLSITVGSTTYNNIKVTVGNSNPALITIDGLPYQDASGHKLTYSLKEGALAGYMTSYNNLASQGTSTTRAFDGGTIVNRAEPATQTVPFEVTKRVVMSRTPTQDATDELWQNERFPISLAYVGYKTDAGDANYTYDFVRNGYYDNTFKPLLAMPGNATVSIGGTTDLDGAVAGNDHKARFDAVRFYKPGTYYFAIEEDELAANVADVYRRDETKYLACVTVTKESGALVAGEPTYLKADGGTTVENNASPTITNVFKEDVDATFTKVWLGQSVSLPAHEFETWPTGKQIEVKLVRYAGNAQDDGFEVVYAISGEDATVAPVSVKVGDVVLTDEALASAQTKYTLTKHAENNLYRYETDLVLDRKVGGNGANAGVDWQYFFAETGVPEGYVNPPLYGSLYHGTVSHKLDAVGQVNSGGVIANKEKGPDGGPELPSTGGMGVASMYMAGCALLALVGIAGLTRKHA